MTLRASSRDCATSPRPRCTSWSRRSYDRASGHVV